MIYLGDNLRNQNVQFIIGQFKSQSIPFFVVGGRAVMVIWFGWTCIKESFWLTDVLIVPLLVLCFYAHNCFSSCLESGRDDDKALNIVVVLFD